MQYLPRVSHDWPFAGRFGCVYVIVLLKHATMLLKTSITSFEVDWIT